MRTIFIARGFTLNATAADPVFHDFRQALAELGYRVLAAPEYLAGLSKVHRNNA